MDVCIFICVDKAGVRERAEKTELPAVVLKKRAYVISPSLSLSLSVYVYTYIHVNMQIYECIYTQMC